MNPFSHTKPFSGIFPARLDDKKRLTIPASMRFEGEGASSYMAIFHPALGAIMVLPPVMVAKIMEASSQLSLSDPDKLDALDVLGTCSQEISCDKAGRVILRDDLLRRARIDRDAEIRGSFTYFRIQSPTPPSADRDSDDARRILKALKELGL